jgi:hypothetical protein
MVPPVPSASQPDWSTATAPVVCGVRIELRGYALLRSVHGGQRE